MEGSSLSWREGEVVAQPRLRVVCEFAEICFPPNSDELASLSGLVLGADGPVTLPLSRLGTEASAVRVCVVKR